MARKRAKPLPPPADPARVKAGLMELRCPWCKRSVICNAVHDPVTGQPTPVASHCGAPFCTAMAEWDDERWAGQALMARARRAARPGRPIPLDALDLEALRRHP